VGLHVELAPAMTFKSTDHEMLSWLEENCYISQDDHGRPFIVVMVGDEVDWDTDDSIKEAVEKMLNPSSPS